VIGEWIIERRVRVSKETVNDRAYAFGLGLGIGFRVKLIFGIGLGVTVGV